MNISYNWLKRYIATDLPAEKIAEILTDIGLEVEGFEKIETVKGGLRGVVVGEVVTCADHPDSDHLHVCPYCCARRFRERLTGVLRASFSARFPPSRALCKKNLKPYFSRSTLLLSALYHGFLSVSTQQAHFFAGCSSAADGAAFCAQ